MTYHGQVGSLLRRGKKQLPAELNFRKKPNPQNTRRNVRPNESFLKDNHPPVSTEIPALRSPAAGSRLTLFPTQDILLSRRNRYHVTNMDRRKIFYTIIRKWPPPEGPGKRLPGRVGTLSRSTEMPGISTNAAEVDPLVRPKNSRLYAKSDI